MLQRNLNQESPLLITGATGFVGRHLIAVARGSGLPNSAIVAASQRKNEELTVRQEVFDITEAQSIFRLIERVRPASVVHLAAIAAPEDARANRDAAWAVNFEGTRLLAEAILRHVPRARLVFAGSAESYGESFNMVDGPISEDAPLRPTSTYGATKAAADIMLGQMVKEGLDVIRTRSFNHSGPGQTPDYVIPAFAQQIANAEAGRQESVVKVGNLDAQRDFLDVRDVVRAYFSMALANSVSADARVVNLSSASAVSVQAILDRMLKMAEIDISVERDHLRMRSSEVPYAAGDNQRLRKYFDWTSRYNLDQTLFDVLTFFRG